MRIAGRLIFPPRCASCRELLPFDAEGGGSVLCPDCRSEWELEKLAACPICGKSMIDCRCMPEMISESGCACLVKLVSYDPARAGGAVNSIINNLKRIRDRDYFDFFASQLMMPVRKILEDFELDPCDVVITFCPRRRSVRRGIGFDQSEELARRMAELGGAEFKTLIGRRPFHFVLEQKRLNAAGRRENARRSMSIVGDGREAAGRYVILIDDIVTTGATISVCADLLRKAGAQLVFAACLATASGSGKR
jgi:ComF family protein